MDFGEFTFHALRCIRNGGPVGHEARAFRTL
jgi:hypothetical protein